VDNARITAHGQDDHDDTLEAHDASLERPHACIDGFVYIGYVVESQHDLDSETVEYRKVPCRRCNAA
jgi:hypothetical protein